MAKCNGTSEDIFHVSNDSDIEVMGEDQAAANDREVKELCGTEVVQPIQ